MINTQKKFVGSESGQHTFASLRRVLASAALFASVALPAQAQVGSDLAADAIEIVAGLDLGLNEPVTPSDYTVAMHLLSMAHELDPSDTDLARSLVEASWLAGDQQVMIQATRAVVRNDPKDTVAQLRLISAIVNRSQTVQDRINAYQRFLGEGSEKIDPSVRSRLTLDMALLEREQGNETGFLAALRQSAKLDTANKEAQSLVAQHYSHKVTASSTRMRLQLRVLYADPLDPHVHIAIAKMCAAEGATDAAWRFLNTAITIFRIDAGRTPDQLQQEQLSLLWQYEGPQAILDQLNPSLNDERETLAATIEGRLAANEPVDDLQTPEDIRYEPGIDRIRLLAAFILENQEVVDSVLLDLRRSLRAYFDIIQEQMLKRGADRSALLGLYLKEVVAYQTMRAIVGVDGEVIKDDLRQITKNSPELERFFFPLEPFSLYAEGKYEEALAIARNQLRRSAPRDLIVGLCFEKLDRQDEAIEIYTQLTLDYPLQAVGAFCRTRLKDLTGNATQITSEGEIMAQIADAVPSWFDKMITNPENTMSLNIVPTKTIFEADEPASLRIQLENLSTLPLSLGNSHPIDSNLLVIPGFRELDGKFRGKPRAKVVDLGRRLRLMPLEQLSINVNPDSVHTRWLLNTQPHSAIRQRWRVLQGFKPMQGGGLINSPFALVSESVLVERRVLPDTAHPFVKLIDGIGSTDSYDFRRTMQGAAAILYRPSLRADLSESELTRMVDAIWDRYAREDTSTRVWMLGILPTRIASPAMKSFDERVQQTLVSESLIDNGVDPVLISMVLMTRVESLGSPVFDITRDHKDNRVQYISGMVNERIKNLEPMYAGVDAPFETFAPAAEQSLGF
ncbi:MAG: hypothetical protein AB8C13_03440 [Phycisphaerales bacterium]